MDFVLWKPSDADLPGWDSPWGRGRPGWHIECSAMSHELLGDSFDIHGGGNDLMFPHHENEIAQSCCANGTEQMAQVWLHNEMLQVEGKKMSKSLGNFFTVRDLLDQGVPGEVIRFVMLSTHYRKPMDWTEKKREDAENLLRKIGVYLARDDFQKPVYSKQHVKPPQEFVEALANDLNTSLALSLVGKYLKEDKEPELYASLCLLGFYPDAIEARYGNFRLSAFENDHGKSVSVSTLGVVVGPNSDDLIKFANRFREEREMAKLSKDFSKLDVMKKVLIAAGLEVRMSKDGVELVPGPDFDPSKLEGIA